MQKTPFEYLDVDFYTLVKTILENSRINEIIESEVHSENKIIDLNLVFNIVFENLPLDLCGRYRAAPGCCRLPR